MPKPYGRGKVGIAGLRWYYSTVVPERFKDYGVWLYCLQWSAHFSRFCISVSVGRWQFGLWFPSRRRVRKSVWLRSSWRVWFGARHA